MITVVHSQYLSSKPQIIFVSPKRWFFCSIFCKFENFHQVPKNLGSVQKPGVSPVSQPKKARKRSFAIPLNSVTLASKCGLCCTVLPIRTLHVISLILSNLPPQTGTFPSHFVTCLITCSPRAQTSQVQSRYIRPYEVMKFLWHHSLLTQIVRPPLALCCPHSFITST